MYALHMYSQDFIDEIYERTEPEREWVEESEDGTGRKMYRLVTYSTWMVPSDK